MSPLPEPADDRLDSWKAIASYLNRGVRTVRRWEQEEGLPVHRHLHRVLGSVYAFKSEIDAWRTAGRRAEPRPEHRGADAVPLAHAAKSIAVLPFVNLSADPENAYFADGLTDEVTADLSRLKSLRVISRTSAMAFKGTSSAVQAIARELGVQYVVQGTVRRAAGQVRITAQLIDAAADSHLWGDKYTGTLENIFAIQERLARVIVEALELRLSADEDRRLAERPIDNVLAYECYLRARHEGWRWRKDAIDHAVQLLQNGLDIVGDNARLYAALGLAYLQYREAGIDLGEYPVERAEACAEKVRTLDPASAAGLQLRGWIHYSRSRIQDAVRDLKTALEAEPGNADTLLLLSNCYLISGQPRAARPLIDRLLAIDPLTPVTRCMPAWADVLDGRFAAAIGPYRQMFEMDPANPMARLFYAWVLMLNHRADLLAEIVGTFPPEVRQTVPGQITQFLEHALAGEADAAHRAMSPEIAAAATAADVFPRMLAQGYALAGMADQAIHWLNIAVDRGFINYPYLSQHDPFFSRLRNDRRVADLLESVRERWSRFEP